MSLNVVLDAFARVELNRIQERFRTASPGRAAAFRKAIGETVESVLAFPEAYRVVHEEIGARHIRVNGFPYFLVYLIDPDTIFVIAVMHERQDPDYWLDRLEP
jgi:plasmid stabilization system protein ParE